MNDDVIKQRILKTAIEIFDEVGFHGATIRNIAQKADCSMPMMYYYYKSKAFLYEEVAVNQFFALIEKLNSNLDFRQHPMELYTQVVMQRQKLEPLDKAIYRIASRLWFGFEGTWEQRSRIIDWEKDRIKDNRRILDRYVKKEEDRQIFAEIFLSFLENEVNKVIFLNMEINEKYFKEQLAFLLNRVN